jgi:cellulose synthase/poly-beta-1,6-N-acetylglucosamine synthase-like glycosyltransferase
MYNATLIISVYKKTTELEIILSSLQKQSFTKEYEILIADDGSGEEMEKFVEQSKKTFGLDLNLITHEDSGFRKNKILNEAIKKAKSDYLIFLDGDCIPHYHFTESHVKYKRPNTVLSGRRVMLGKKLSEDVKKSYKKHKSFEITFSKLLIDSIRSKHASVHIEEAIYIESEQARSFINANKTNLLGCNFSIQKYLIEKVNGFDEDYTGPGIGEDTDIEYRLKLVSAEFESLRNLAIVYHLFHPKTIEERKNYDYFHTYVKKSGNYFCKNGLIKS